MNRQIFALLIIFLIAISFNCAAQDTWSEIRSYDPETDPQVNFTEQMIESATGVSAEGSGTGEAAPAETADEGAPTVTPAAEGSEAARLVRAAAELYRRYKEPHSFPYLPETNGGNLGCAQVVNHIFEEAGMPIVPNYNPNRANDDYYARIRVKDADSARGAGTVDRLLRAGWVEVTPPPYQAGDVITWNTTGRPDSHIGIIMATGNNVKAISNSSTYGRPRFNPAGSDYAPMTRLLRKAS